MKSIVSLLALSLTTCLQVTALAQTKTRNSDVEKIGARNINRGSINFISLEKEVALGVQLSGEYERSARLSNNATVNDYVNRIGENLASNSDAQIPLHFKVVESDEVDSSAFPGGFIYINTGTILVTDNEAEVASVLSLQIAHIAARHATELASKAELINLRLQDGPLIFHLIETGDKVPTQFLQFLRQQVTEADYLGLQYLYKAGYDAEAAVSFLQKIQLLQSIVAPSISSAGPPVTDRIKAIQKNIGLMLSPRTQNIVNTAEFDSVKNQLKR